MPIASNRLEFVEYYSRLKVFLFGLLFVAGFCSVVFSGIEDHTYYRWAYQPWAYPIRIALAIGSLGLIIIVLRMLVPALKGVPMIRVCDNLVAVNYGKRGTFSVSDISEIGSVFNGDYYIRVGKKKYGISPFLAKTPETLRDNMDLLVNLVNAK